MKKFLSLFLFFAVIFSLVVGCSLEKSEGNHNSKSEIYEDDSIKKKESTCCYKESNGTFCQEKVPSYTNYCEKHQIMLDEEFEKYKEVSEIINSEEFDKISKAIDEMKKQQEQELIEEFDELQKDY